MEKYRQGDVGGALGELIRAVNGKPDSPVFRNMLGVIYFNQGNLDKAEEQFRKAIRLDDSYAEAYNNLGSLYIEKQEYRGRVP